MRFFRFPSLSRRQITRDVDDELAYHIDRVAESLRAAGWPDADARAEAQRRFGDVDFTRQYCREQDVIRERGRQRMNLLEELRQDLSYSARSLRTAPAFTIAALLTLALGIGANTAVFSVIRGVLLEPLPFAEPQKLIRVWHAQPGGGIERGSVSEPDFLDWRAATRAASSMGAWFFAEGMTGVDMYGEGQPERVATSLVTDGFFQTLGTAPLGGRFLQPDDHTPGRDRVIVLSHGFWTRRFGANPDIIGRTITLRGEPFQVVGVMPAGFTFPAELALDGWIPLSVFGPDQIGRSRGVHFLQVVARAAPGVSERQLREELSAFADRSSREFPDNPGWTSVNTLPIRDALLGDLRRPLFILMATVALLLLIACVNIANLLLARATARRIELAVRAAVGAGRGRITRQLLTESLAIAVAGGALGIGLGYLAVRGLTSTGAANLPRMASISIDTTVLLFTAAVSLACGVVFGLIPALRASQNLEAAVREGGRGSQGGASHRLRSALVVAEVALAVVLVIGAGLMAKSFARLLSVDTGYETSGGLVILMTVGERYERGPARRAYYVSILDAIRRVPGVRSAGSVRDLPTRGNGEMVRPGVEGRQLAEDRRPSAQLHHISTDFFRAMGIPLLAGRDFQLTDSFDSAPVIVVNEELARRVWPGESAIGRALTFGETQLRVVGVVGNVRQLGPDDPVEPTMYVHALQNFRSRMSIVIRTQGDPARYADAVRKAIWSVDPNQTITQVTTLEEMLGRVVARPRLLAWLMGVFGLLGLTLGVLGIFGVLAYAVNQRRQEIGVRVALGATPGRVLGSVVGRGLGLAAVGVVIGLVGAAMLTRSLQSLLFGITPTDAATFAQVSAILLVAALLASWLPAQRALRIDPVSALKP